MSAGLPGVADGDLESGVDGHVAVDASQFDDPADRPVREDGKP
jgi:hypothetical protein